MYLFKYACMLVCLNFVFAPVQTPLCTENVCNGSVMIPNLHVHKPVEVRSKEELLKLATDFIDQYYTSIKR